MLARERAAVLEGKVLRIGKSKTEYTEYESIGVGEQGAK